MTEGVCVERDINAQQTLILGRGNEKPRMVLPSTGSLVLPAVAVLDEPSTKAAPGIQRP